VQAATQPDAPGGGASAGCWTARQIAASLDYSVPAGPSGRASPLETSVVTALSAGLNVQSLHHAMPSVACAHFPRLYPEYAEICSRHGVQLRQSDNAATAVAEMLRYVFDNNAPEGGRKDRRAS
jgi:fatty acid desaturase